MKRTAGFTLIEMAVTIAIAAILAAIAIPAYRSMTATNRVTGAVNAFASSLALARSEAIARGEQVAVCPSANATGGNPTCDKGGWQEGWIVFVDANGDGQYVPGAGTNGDQLIRVHGSVGNISMVGTGANDAIAFDRMGFARPTFSGTSDTSLTVVACPHGKRDANARAVILYLSGAVKTAARKPDDGGPFSCS